jgi:phosphoribosylformylglycinamidine synthase
VLLINPEHLARFARICERERCGFSNVGTVVSNKDGKAKLVLKDEEPTIKAPIQPIDLPMDVLFPPGHRIERHVGRIEKTLWPFNAAKSLQEKCGSSDLGSMITQATKLVFNLPAVGSKMFLITIGDRVSVYPA